MRHSNQSTRRLCRHLHAQLNLWRYTVGQHILFISKLESYMRQTDLRKCSGLHPVYGPVLNILQHRKSTGLRHLPNTQPQGQSLEHICCFQRISYVWVFPFTSLEAHFSGKSRQRTSLQQISWLELAYCSETSLETCEQTSPMKHGCVDPH